MRLDFFVWGWNSDIKAGWSQIKVGWGQIGRPWVGWQDKGDENPREGCGDGRLREEKKAPTWPQSKQVKKHEEDY